MILGSFLGAFTNSYGMYLGGRFVLGFGNSLSQLACPVLLVEICHPQHRPQVSSIYNCLWDAGATSEHLGPAPLEKAARNKLTCLGKFVLWLGSALFTSITVLGHGEVSV